MNDPEEVSSPPAPDGADACTRCLKPLDLCVCAGIEPIDNKRHLLILQHPQEQDRDLGTARLTLLHFRKASLKIGLSWPNLAKAAGRPEIDPRRWAVLYLGPAKLPDNLPAGSIAVLDKEAKPLPPEAQRLVLDDLEGVILLDGSWSQAKTLWWRNAWLLKSWRIVLTPLRPSRYGKLRKEPRRESVSTLEATAQIMAALENRKDIAPALVGRFETLLTKYRARKPQGKPSLRPL